MKIVVVGGSQKMRTLMQILKNNNAGKVLFLGNEKYEVKADDCVIYDDELRDNEQISEIFSLKFREQQPLKIWSLKELGAEIEKFGYQRDGQEQGALSQIFNFLFTGRKLPYEKIRITARE